MNLQISWDVVIIATIGVIVAYSFIIGRNNVFKVIVNTYIAAFLADSIMNIIGSILFTNDKIMQLLRMMGINNQEEAIIFSKIGVFLFLIVIISIAVPYEIDLEDDRSRIKLAIGDLFFGLANSLLFISILLIFVSGSSFIWGQASSFTSTFNEISNQSELARFIIGHYPYLFLFPVGVYVFTKIGAKIRN